MESEEEGGGGGAKIVEFDEPFPLQQEDREEGGKGFSSLRLIDVDSLSKKEAGEGEESSPFEKGFLRMVTISEQRQGPPLRQLQGFKSCVTVSHFAR